jgi:hypothetical protein
MASDMQYIAPSLRQSLRELELAGMPTINQRETKVPALIAEDLTNKQIASLILRAQRTMCHYASSNLKEKGREIVLANTRHLSVAQLFLIIDAA